MDLTRRAMHRLCKIPLSDQPKVQLGVVLSNCKNHDFMKAIKVFLFIIIGSSPLFGQSTYSLQECIEIARKNNIGAQQSQLSVDQNEVALNSAKMARLPNLNAGVSNSYNFGRTIDPFTNAFINQNVTAVSTNLSSGVTLYNGLRLNNDIKSAKANYEASQLDIEALENDIALDIAALYLSVLMAREQVKVFENNITQTKDQLKRIEILLEAGATTIDRKYELEAQLGNDELQLTNATNNSILSLLNLKIYMNLPPDQTLEIETMEANDVALSNIEEVDLQSVVQENFKSLPQAKRDEMLKQASEYNVSSALGSRQPSLTLSANLNSIYSSQSQLPVNPRLEELEVGYVGSTQDAVFTQRQVFDYQTPGLTNQLQNNFGQTFGFTLSIPIFNRNLINAGIDNSKINHQRASLQLEGTKNQIQNNVYQAYYSWLAADKAYESANKAFDAQKKLFDQMQLRYDAGAVNYFDWVTARNNLTASEINLVQARFDLIFKEKTFGFYQGKEIGL